MAQKLANSTRIGQRNARRQIFNQNNIDTELEYNENMTPGSFLIHSSKMMNSFITLMIKSSEFGLDNDAHVKEGPEGFLLFEAYSKGEVTLDEVEDMWPENLWPAAAPAAAPAAVSAATPAVAPAAASAAAPAAERAMSPISTIPAPATSFSSDLPSTSTTLIPTQLTAIISYSSDVSPIPAIASTSRSIGSSVPTVPLNRNPTVPIRNRLRNSLNSSVRPPPYRGVAASRRRSMRRSVFPRSVPPVSTNATANYLSPLTVLPTVLVNTSPVRAITPPVRAVTAPVQRPVENMEVVIVSDDDSSIESSVDDDNIRNHNNARNHNTRDNINLGLARPAFFNYVSRSRRDWTRTPRNRSRHSVDNQELIQHFRSQMQRHAQFSNQLPTNMLQQRDIIQYQNQYMPEDPRPRTDAVQSPIIPMVIHLVSSLDVVSIILFMCEFLFYLCFSFH